MQAHCSNLLVSSATPSINEPTLVNYTSDDDISDDEDVESELRFTEAEKRDREVRLRKEKEQVDHITGKSGIAQVVAASNKIQATDIAKATAIVKAYMFLTENKEALTVLASDLQSGASKVVVNEEGKPKVVRSSDADKFLSSLDDTIRPITTGFWRPGQYYVDRIFGDGFNHYLYDTSRRWLLEEELHNTILDERFVIEDRELDEKDGKFFAVVLKWVRWDEDWTCLCVTW
ncbi:hypothetical protein OHC33_001133 [Knufia fluminis]|uniref:Uncharacterized protein n=1 Tax=Knufia fluminis TaxID=191047 RepID=A0AAN8F6Q6_9EURO|nr:hypothetical protein OHC33_001133 [Knufia fluminis]